MILFGRELSLEQMVGLVECNATPDEDLVHRAALEIIAALRESQRMERAAVEDMLKVLLSQLEKEKAIISNEHGKDYAHLNFADGRRHTLMRVEAWAKTQIKKRRGPQAEEGGAKK